MLQDLKNKLVLQLQRLQKKENAQKEESTKTDSWTHYYQDIINPYDMIFHPSYLETDEKFYEFRVLNDMSWAKKANYLKPLLRYPRLTTVNLFFSPTDPTTTLTEYKKIVRSLELRIQKEEEEWREVEKKLLKMLEDYKLVIYNLEEGTDSYLNYSILFAQELDKKDLGWEPLALFQEERANVWNLFRKRVESPSKFYIPRGQIEESYVSRLPLAEYRLKDWSNISASSASILFPFFTETKTPSVEDGVPYGINRNTWELFFMNHSKMYEDGYITNRNMNVFGGTGSWKSSFIRSQIPLRISYGDHFVIFDPKRDYTAFSKDMWGQTIQFKISEPIGYNIFTKSTDVYEVNGERKEVQTLEDKKTNIIRIFKIMCSYLTEESSSAEFSLTILDSALSYAYSDSPDGSKISFQNFYDTYLSKAIKEFTKNEPEKINNYTEAGERLRANLGNFVVKEDGTPGAYYKMFLPVEKEKEIVLKNNPLITFDLYDLFKDDKIFAVASLIWMEFVWNQVTKRKWSKTGKTIYVVIDENWKLLQYEAAAEYEESFSRLIRWLWGGIYTLSQNVVEYFNSKAWQQVLYQAQTNIILKLEDIQFKSLQEGVPNWFTEEVIEDFIRINGAKNSYGTGYIAQRWRLQPFKYLYLPARNWRDSWQEAEEWQTSGADYTEWYEVK